MSFEEKRKYPRVKVRQTLAEYITTLEARATWPTLEATEVCDISENGICARRPGVYKVADAQQVTVQVKLGDMNMFPAEARVAWTNAEWIGLEFQSVSAEGKKCLSEFLEAKLVAGKMAAVDPAKFSAAQTFQRWYQGPNNTNVYVWMTNDNQIQQVNVDFAGQKVELERSHGLHFKPLPLPIRQSLRLLSQMDKPDLPMEEFVRSLIGGV